MSLSLVVLIPIFNDWQNVQPLLLRLDRAIRDHNCACDVLLVDDGSTELLETALNPASYQYLHSVSVLHLSGNVGHQRAIAVGLVHVYQKEKPDAVLVMDGDGEDKPEDIPQLLATFEKHGREKVVFAARAKRLENLVFRIFYRVYRWVHWLVVGEPVRVGNFSVVPARYLSNLVVSSNLWNHYAAAVVRARIPAVNIPIARGQRLMGTSKMNFYSLVVHGFSAMTVFVDIISVRLLSATVAFSVLSLVLLATVVAIRMSTDLAIPGWATSAVGLLIVVFLQMVLLAAILVFLVMHSRTSMSFVPMRDGHHFIRSVRRIYPVS